MGERRINIQGIQDYTGVSLEDIIEDLKNWHSYTGETILRLKELKKEAQANFERLEEAEEIIEYISYCIILFQGYKADFKRLLDDIIQGVEERHVEIVKQIFESSRDEERYHNREFKREHIAKELKDESLRPLLDEIYSLVGGELLYNINLHNLSRRLQTFVGSTVSFKKKEESTMKYDAFICHASEDKDDFVHPLAEKLIVKGLKVWYDEFALKLGDSLRQSIDNGLANSRYGIVVLSPSFFEKDWPQMELNALYARERNGVKVILPIWHKIDKEEIIRHSPLLADRVAAKSRDGITKVTEKVLEVIKYQDKEKIIDRSADLLSGLSKEEQKFLISALKHGGIIYIIETNQTGEFVQIGDEDFLRDADPEIRVTYLEILENFMHHRIVRKESPRAYCLTKTGFQLAKLQHIKSLMEKGWDFYKNKGEYYSSIEAYKKIVDKYPEYGEAKEAQKMIGINYWHLEKYKESEFALKKAIDMGNNFSSTYFYYGEALLKNNRQSEAKEAFKTSLSLPDAPDWIKRKVSERIKLI